MFAQKRVHRITETDRNEAETDIKEPKRTKTKPEKKWLKKRKRTDTEPKQAEADRYKAETDHKEPKWSFTIYK